jgi:hypothetical protein
MKTAKGSRHDVRGVLWLVAVSSCGGSTFSADNAPDGAASDGAAGEERTESDVARDVIAPTPDAAHDAARIDGQTSDARSADGPSIDARSIDAGSRYRGAVLADAPIAYWRMGIASGSIVPDESGHHNDLVLQGTGHAFGVRGALQGDGDRAIGFDGVDSHAIASRPRDFDFPASAPFTVECWARRERTTDGGTGEYFQQLISAAAGGPPNRNGYILYLLPSDPDPSAVHTSFEYDAPDGAQTGIEGPLAAASAYAHYVATFDGTKASLYIDGTLADSRPVNASIAARMSEFVVGREAATGRYHFAGAIDEVAVYGNALPIARVIAHRDAALGK